MPALDAAAWIGEGSCAGTAGAGEGAQLPWLVCGAWSGRACLAGWPVAACPVGGITAAWGGTVRTRYTANPRATATASPSTPAQFRRREADARVATADSCSAGRITFRSARAQKAAIAVHAACRFNRCQEERADATSPAAAGRDGWRRWEAWAEVASSSSRLTLQTMPGARYTRSYSRISGAESMRTTSAMARMCLCWSNTRPRGLTWD